MHWNVYSILTTKQMIFSMKGLKTLKCPKQVKKLVPLKNDLIDMLKVMKLQKKHQNS